MDGCQVERPDNWLRRPDPWEVPRHAEALETGIHCAYYFDQGAAHLASHHPATLRGIPYDRPVVGYGGRTINTLRLWEATSPDYFDLNEFNHGDFFGAVHDKLLAENITRVLYPDDSTSAGHHLRFLQEYFLVACSLADIVRRFRHANRDWRALPDKVAIQLNDTHPALAVAELMRILLDEALLGWEEAWDLTVRTLAYTNHTLLPEALEKWPVALVEMTLPRHLEIIYEINRRFLDGVRARFPGDESRVQRVSLIEEGEAKQVRMASLAIVGTHSTNGVSAIHSELLRERTVKDLAEILPKRFGNKTNGVTPRRWLLVANPELAGLICEAIGKGWTTNLGELAKLIIRLINQVAAAIDTDPAVRGRLKVLFLPDYGVTLAERLIPASDVSEQISTAGYEASGTSNMKFMMNGALTVGTRDGATIEMAQEAGEENFFLFGLTAEQVASSRAGYDPHWHYANEPETRAALDLIAAYHFSGGDRGAFAPIIDALLRHGDFFMHLADLRAYAAAQAKVGATYADQAQWARKAILNVAKTKVPHLFARPLYSRTVLLSLDPHPIPHASHWMFKECLAWHPDGLEYQRSVDVVLTEMACYIGYVGFELCLVAAVDSSL